MVPGRVFVLSVGAFHRIQRNEENDRSSIFIHA
jgi:hypothetical protein